MKKLSRSRYAPWLTGAAAGLVTFSGGEKLAAAPVMNLGGASLERQAELEHYGFSYDRVLGTSLDLVVDAARPADAVRAEAAVMAEISRLNAILSTYTPDSEISRVRGGAAIESPELAELLQAYATWAGRTEGLVDVNMAGVIAQWKEAARTGVLPDRAALAAAALTPRAWNVDALGKGFIIDRAVQTARRYVPAGLLNIGGDIRVWGDRDWLVGVAHPGQPADNAAPLVTVSLRESAIATSGGYARFSRIAGRDYSHLIDPRTQWAAGTRLAASVVAPDTLTANALSTAFAIGGEPAVAKFAGLNPGSLLAGTQGIVAGTGIFAAAIPTAAAAPNTSAAAAPAAAWPQDFQVAINLTLKNPNGQPAGSQASQPPADFGGRGFPGGGPGGRGGRGPGGPGGAKRPFVAIWIEDAAGKVVRTVALWAPMREQKYIPEMTSWFRKINGDWDLIASLSRATRAPGKYTINWDGLNDAGKPVPQGDYVINVEINREHGGHTTQKAAIKAGSEAATVDLKATSESEASAITYGPKSATPAP